VLLRLLQMARIVVEQVAWRVGVMRSWVRCLIERLDGASERLIAAGVVFAGIASSFLLMGARLRLRTILQAHQS
jgi:hypothetical protein